MKRTFDDFAHTPEHQKAAAETRRAMGKEEEKPPLPIGRTIPDLLNLEPDPEDTLLGDRWLCRRGAALLVGPAGVGKSSSSMQQDILWSVGREAFGIKPVRPMRILVIQAENDDGDLHEMATGVCNGVARDLSADEMQMLGANVRYFSIVSLTGESFLGELRRLLEAWPCDLVRIDPLFAFYGAKIEDSEKLSAFLRTGLNPILHEFNIGCILAHHTPKIINRDTTNWTPTDYSYAAAGGAELTNWARAVMVLDPTPVPGTFKLVAAKRGGRIGWRDAFGDKEFIRYYRHAKQDDAIYWEDGDEQAVEQARAEKKAQAKSLKVDPEPIILELVPESRAIDKAELVKQVNKRGAGIVATKDVIRDLITRGTLHEHKEKRTGGQGARDQVLVAKFPQVGA